MVKIRRNRQPKDWQSMTKARSHSGILRSNAENRVSQLTPESQLRKVEKNKRRLRNQVERLKLEKNNSKTSIERKTWIEGALLKIERRLTKTIVSAMALEAQVEKNKLAFEKREIESKKKDEISKVNSEKIKPGTVKYAADNNGFHPVLAGKGKIKEFVEVNSGKRRVRRKFITEEKVVGNRTNTNGPVKVKNPNRTGTIYLPPKKKG